MVLGGADLRETFERFKGNFAEDDLRALQEGILAAGSDEGGERCMWAWDLRRLIYLSAMGYVTDFLSWDEAMEWRLQAGQKLQGIFSGWDSFMRSYLFGYRLWAGERLEDEDGEAYERKRFTTPIVDREAIRGRRHGKRRL
ncbi:MAG: DUF1266 domain-containing protein [Helicobacteraceae bacterium]|nr:DUF1266 domain-containing protein [Helicobacteraceae bacterium]